MGGHQHPLAKARRELHTRSDPRVFEPEVIVVEVRKLRLGRQTDLDGYIFVHGTKTHSSACVRGRGTSVPRVLTRALRSMWVVCVDGVGPRLHDNLL